MSLSRFFLLITFVCFTLDAFSAAPVTSNDPELKAAIINYGRGLNREISQFLMRNILNFNTGLKNYANTIPRDSSFHDLVIPIHYTSNMGNIGAPYTVKHFVSKPIEKVTNFAAEWVDYIGGRSKMVSNYLKHILASDAKTSPHFSPYVVPEANLKAYAGK